MKTKPMMVPLVTVMAFNTLDNFIINGLGIYFIICLDININTINIKVLRMIKVLVVSG